MAVQLARVLGAGKVILVGTRDSRLAIGREVGADVLVNSRNEDAVEAVKRLTDGVMADMVVETSGSAAGGAQALELCKKSGRVALVGIYSEPVTVNLNKVVQWNMQIDRLSHILVLVYHKAFLPASVCSGKSCSDRQEAH